MQTVIPLGLRDRRQASTGVPQYDFKGSKPLNTTILFDPTTGVNGSQPLSCPAMAADLPNGELLGAQGEEQQQEAAAESGVSGWCQQGRCQQKEQHCLLLSHLKAPCSWLRGARSLQKAKV